MKNLRILLIASLALFMVACNKSNDVKIKVERPQYFEMPALGKLDFQRPFTPAYIPDNNAASGRSSTVKVEAGSNKLQAIIDAAAPGTTIKLRAGQHTEENTLVINRSIKLRGEEGAVLSLGGALGLLVIGADDVEIKDLEINNTGTGLLAIGVENSADFEFKRNHLSGFTYSLVLEGAYKANIVENVVSGIDPQAGLGIVAMNGERVETSRNDVSGNLFGIWACDKKGRCYNNVLHENTFGLILCKVPATSFSSFFPNGTGGSIYPAIEWKAKNNALNNNAWGIIAIDGAQDNFLSGNTASGNAFVDLELAAETNQLFGFTTPVSQGNVVHAGDLNYIDCGDNNTLYNGNLIELPCSE